MGELFFSRVKFNNNNRGYHSEWVDLLTELGSYDKCSKSGYLLDDRWFIERDEYMLTNEIKYKEGDVVLITLNRTQGMTRRGSMDGYLGAIMTINRVVKMGTIHYYEMIEDGGSWCWDDEMIVGTVDNPFDHFIVTELINETWVKLRNGELMMVTKVGEKYTGNSKSRIIDFTEYTKEFRHPSNPEFDIMKVCVGDYKVHDMLTGIWNCNSSNVETFRKMLEV